MSGALSCAPEIRGVKTIWPADMVGSVHGAALLRRASHRLFDTGAVVMELPDIAAFRLASVCRLNSCRCPTFKPANCGGVRTLID